MACCADRGECATHKGHAGKKGSERVVTQSQADACCGVSEREQSNSSSPTAVATISPAVLGVGVVFSAITPSLTRTDGWRLDTPIHRAPVHRHLLLSVFLV
jgi:hypothetical protein